MLIEPPPESEVDRVSGGVVLCFDNSGRILLTLLSSGPRTGKTFTVSRGHISDGHGPSPIPISETPYSARPVVPIVSHRDRRSCPRFQWRDASTDRSSRWPRLSPRAHAAE